jgi:FAD/FMN-containing dehydrogenase
VSDFQTNRVDSGGTIDIRLRTVFTPTSASDIAKVITTANQQNRRVRACGSGWSFSDVAVSHDYIVELSKQNYILDLSVVGWHNCG